MNMEIINIAISFVTQSPKHIEIFNTSSIFDALSMANIEEVDGQDLYVFHRGKLISNLYLSLSAYNVGNTDRLFVATKRRKDDTRTRHFLDSIQIQEQIRQTQQSNNNSCYCCCICSNEGMNYNSQQEALTNMKKKGNKITMERRAEYFRLTDIAFNSWETIKTFPKMLAEMLKMQEIHTAASNHLTTVTNLNFMSEISEEPLPGIGFVAQNDRNGHACGIESN